MTDRTGSETPRRRWGTRQQALVLVAGLLALLWGADALARVGAQTLIARSIQDATGVADQPVVKVRGVLFLPQLIRGAYNEVNVTTRGITNGPLPVERLDSQLFDVRVPFHDVLVRDVRQVGIGRSVEIANLRYDDLNAYLATTGRPLRLASAPDGQVKITGSVDLGNGPVEASADATLSVDNGAVKVTPRQIDTGTNTLDQATRLLLGQRLNLTVPLGNLPFGHQLTGATPYPDGIRVEATGTGIVLPT
jgi:hypothetical protein